MRIEKLLNDLGCIRSEAGRISSEINDGLDVDLISVREYWKAMELAKANREIMDKICKAIQEELVYSYHDVYQREGDSLEGYE